MKTTKQASVKSRRRPSRRSAAAAGMCFLMALACGCAAQRKPATPTADNSAVRIVHETVVDTVTVYIDIPRQSAERLAPDSLSRLATDYAESEARIMADGSLWHTLANKPQRLDMPVAVEQRRDSVISTVDRMATVEVEVEKRLSLWQKVRLWAFWPLVALLILAAIALRREAGRRNM